MTASAEHPPPEDHRPDERRKMTVSERDIGALATDLHGWLAGRLGHHPESARIHLQDRAGTPLTLELDTITSVPLHVGAGYGGDPDWSHGRWMGRGWSQASVYDLTDPAVAGRIPFGVIDHLARAGFDGEEGWGCSSTRAWAATTRPASRTGPRSRPDAGPLPLSGSARPGLRPGPAPVKETFLRRQADPAPFNRPGHPPSG
ncbi:MAG TPA: hypothetical protein VFJ07_20330 [Streptosporangiaceae bacterium]|nr:hypothetical protein [Streptosporangiaceae bacterium]